MHVAEELVSAYREQGKKVRMELNRYFVNLLPQVLRCRIDLFREDEGVVRSLHRWRTLRINEVVWPMYRAYRKLTRPFRKLES